METAKVTRTCRIRQRCRDGSTGGSCVSSRENNVVTSSVQRLKRTISVSSILMFLCSMCGETFALRMKLDLSSSSASPSGGWYKNNELRPGYSNKRKISFNKDIRNDVSTPVTSYLCNEGEDNRKAANLGSANGQNRKVAAPVVDSDLLRFLATTKRATLPPREQPTSVSKKETFNKETSKRPEDPSKPVPSAGSSSYYLSCLAQETSNAWENVVNRFAAAVRSESTAGKKPQKQKSFTPIIAVNEVEEMARSPYPCPSFVETSPWLSQFDAERVSAVLVREGVDKDDARKAGIEVQRYAYDRARKLFIRRFLRKRDSVWASTSSLKSSVPYLNLAENIVESDAQIIPRKFENNGNNVDKRDLSRLNGAEDNDRYDNTPLENVVSELLSFGLTAKDCATIFLHTPSLAMSGGAKIAGNVGEVGVPRTVIGQAVDKVLNGVLCGTLGLRKYDARKVLRSCPRLLTVRGSAAAEQVVDLFSALNVSPSALAREKATLPNLLCRSPSTLFRLVAFLSSDSVKMPVERIGAFLRRSDCSELLDTVAPVPTQNGLVPLLKPGTAAYNDVLQVRTTIDETYRAMRISSNKLRSILGDKGGVATVVAAYPTALLLDPSEQIDPLLSFFQVELEFVQHDVRKVICAFPSILAGDVKRMRSVVEYLSSLDLTIDDLRKVFRAFPSLLTLDVTKDMVPVVEFLRSIGVRNIARFITRLPPVLGYSVHGELMPKWKYLMEVCENSYFEVVKFPAYFSYPLDRVIATRYEYLRARGMPQVNVVAVDEVLRYGDIDFATKVAGDRDGGALFTRFVKERRQNKRKSQQRKQQPNKRKQTRNRPGAQKRQQFTS